jgi:hypothetical protein
VNAGITSSWKSRNWSSEAWEAVDGAARPALDEERVGKRYEEVVEACRSKVLLDFLYPVTGCAGYRERRAQLG